MFGCYRRQARALGLTSLVLVLAQSPAAGDRDATLWSSGTVAPLSASAWAGRGEAALKCDILVDTIDWPKLLRACSGWALRRAYSSLGHTILRLSDYFEGVIGEAWRIQSHPCIGGLFAARLVGLDMFLADDQNFFGLSSDISLKRGYWLFANQSWEENVWSPFTRTAFLALSAYNKRAKDACPHFAGPPTAFQYDRAKAMFPCVGKARKQVIHLGLPSPQAKWCSLFEPAPLFAEKLWAAAQSSLAADQALPELVDATAEYFRSGSYCDEADAVAYLSAAWAGTLPRQEALRRAQAAVRLHDFAHSIFSRWPVWELWLRFTKVSPDEGPLTASACVNYELCTRTVDYYRSLRTPLTEMPGPCPSFPGVSTEYRDGFLHANLTAEVDADQFYFELYDTTKVLQRMKTTDAQDIGLYGARMLRRTTVGTNEFPKRLGFEGIRVYSALHRHDNPEVHVEPQRDDSFARYHFKMQKSRGPSIYVLVLDSVTRASFQALCPRTQRYLRSKAAQATWRNFDFPRFHAMYGGTAGNMFPLLTGRHYNLMMDSARRASWDCNAIREGIPTENLLWNVMKVHGYVTGFGATGCNGMTGTRYCDDWLSHFHHVPPSLQVDFSCVSQHEWSEAQLPPKHGCIGSKRPHEHLLGYFQRFFEIYTDSPAFAYLHLEATHDNPKALQLLDRTLEAHLRALAALPPESRPIVLLAGDHGRLGECDWVSPMVNIMLPQSLIESGKIRPKHLELLRSNRMSITSWFDLHATLIHLATGSNPRWITGGARPWTMTGQETKSLLGLVPSNRTCVNAGVPKSYCGCAQQWVQWCPVNPKGLMTTVAMTVDGLNKQVASFMSRQAGFPAGHCPPLVLSGIVKCETLVDDVRRYSSGDGNDEEVLLRLQFDVTSGFIFELHVSTAMRRSADRVVALAKDVFDIKPVSLYRRYESCAPVGVDPAMCHCAPPDAA